MTVKDLIKALQACDPKALVVQSKDAEGNDYSPTANVESARYEAETTWRGELVTGKPNAIVLWPVN